VSAALSGLGIGSARAQTIARDDVTLAPRPGSVLRRGEIVFHVGEPATAAYFVDSGWTALQRLSAAGRSFTLAWHGQGAALGLAETLLGLPYQATAVMVTAGSVRRVSQAELRAQLRAGGRPAELVMEALSRGWKDMAERLAAFGLADSAPQRLAHFVLAWAEDSTPRPPLRHEEIAAQCGLARETVSRLVSDWRRQGIAAVRGGRAVVRDPARLRQIEAQGWHRTAPS
jgi:CRP/FNR family cyclic AMP-dependent transcriptional regulator